MVKMVDAICISLMTGEVEYLFVCLLAIWTSSFLKYLFKSLGGERQRLRFISESHLGWPSGATGIVEVGSLGPLANTNGISLRCWASSTSSASLNAHSFLERSKLLSTSHR